MMSTAENPAPLCIDLDGTLIKTDLLVESFFQLLKNNFLYIFLTPFWLIRGKACLKSRIAERVEITVALLPYDEAFLSFLKTQRNTGRKLVLITASHEKFAHQIAEYLGIFDTVIATREGHNLSGRAKRDLLVQQYGKKGFDYAGNATPDLQIWQCARLAILVAPERGVEKAAQRCTRIERVFRRKQPGVGEYLRAMRPHQWLKNILVFIPLLVSHKWNDTGLLLQATGAFFAFSSCASAVYLLNDMVDLPDDRRHARKRARPFAAGSACVKKGVTLAGVLLVVAGGISMLVTPLFLAVLVFYFLTTVVYSTFFKRIVLVDVLTLAGLYTTRIIAGAAAIQVKPSFWLLAFSMFLFISLAMVKRFAELLVHQEFKRDSPVGRGYRIEDLETLGSHGASAGYLSVLVLALYINSPDVRVLYSRPEIIWLLCPLLLYWVSRVWLVARRGGMHDDPVLFALGDRISHLLAVMAFIIVLLAM